MYIEHIAIWSRNLEDLRAFYETWFQASASEKYINSAKQFESYFLTFSTGARLELMRSSTIADLSDDGQFHPAGYSHIAFSVGSKTKVDTLTNELKQSGIQILDEPRQTGDGYYESVVLDPDGNRVEITV